MREKTYVYFLKPIGMDGPIKIGCSNLPERRLVALASWSPFKLEIIGRTPGTHKDEAFLHCCFSELHTHHEWFYFTPALGETIAKILASSIDEVRKNLTPKSPIRRGRKLKADRTLSERQYALTISQVKATEKRLRNIDEKGAWRAPNDVDQIMDRWHGNSYKHRPAVHPTDAEIARVWEYLENPAVHSRGPYMRPRMDSICVPIFGLEDAA